MNVIFSLIFLARRCGNVAVTFSVCQSALGRTQTRLLTMAQFRGWKPENDEAMARLQKRQFNLSMWRMAKLVAKKEKRGEPVFQSQKPEKTNP
jgi:hypothetical protein